MRAFIDWVYRALKFLLTFLIAILIIPVTWQILARFTDLIPAYIWTEEMARFCLVWIIMIGASVGVRDASHFDVDMFPHPKSVAGQAIARMVIHVSILLVALTFVGFGWRFAMFGFDQESELTGINMITIHIAWPFAGLTWMLFMLEKLYDDWQLIKNGEAKA
jgi:TRAP-type C4-dicarboxylate transport system permease small subunit